MHFWFDCTLRNPSITTRKDFDFWTKYETQLYSLSTSKTRKSDRKRQTRMYMKKCEGLREQATMCTSHKTSSQFLTVLTPGAQSRVSQTAAPGKHVESASRENDWGLQSGHTVTESVFCEWGISIHLPHPRSKFARAREECQISS